MAIICEVDSLFISGTDEEWDVNRDYFIASFQSCKENMQKKSETSESPFLIITAMPLEMQGKQRNSFDDLPKAAF